MRPKVTSLHCVKCQKYSFILACYIALALQGDKFGQVEWLWTLIFTSWENIQAILCASGEKWFYWRKLTISYQIRSHILPPTHSTHTLGRILKFVWPYFFVVSKSWQGNIESLNYRNFSPNQFLASPTPILWQNPLPIYKQWYILRDPLCTYSEG